MKNRERESLLTMEEAIDRLKTTRSTFYRWLRSGKIKGVKIGRQWRFESDDINRFLKGEAPQIALTANPDILLHELEDRIKECGGEPKHLIDPPKNPIYALVDSIIELAILQKASDIHIEPFNDEEGWSLILRNRIGGVLHLTATGDLRLLAPIIERFKSLSALNTNITDLPQDGRIKLRIFDIQIDLRISVVPVTSGESLVARILQKPKDLSLDRLGLSPHNLKILKKTIASSHGVILLNGPTGCGKTSTIYTCLMELGKQQLKTMTIEDPVELLIPWVTQLSVNKKKGKTFSAMIRSALRQDPDVLMIGEIRDLESLKLAYMAATTGHLIFTSLHCPDSAGAIQKLTDLGLEPFLIGDSTLLIFSQRLIRRLCPHCKEKTVADKKVFKQLKEILEENGHAASKLKNSFYQPKGCSQCSQMGYLGRLPISEALTVSSSVFKLIKQGSPSKEIHKQAIKEGMISMAVESILKLFDGETSLMEIERIKSITG